MDDPEYDVHPLDRDYSEPEPKAKRLPRMPEGQVHRAGVITFLVGFVALLVTAVLLGIFRGAGWVETFGSYVHRFAMVMILAGGLLILIGLRVRQWPQIRGRGPARRLSSPDLARLGYLLTANVVFFFAYLGFTFVLRENMPQAFFGTIYVATLTSIGGLMAMTAVLQRGPIRGFAIGVVFAMLMGAMTNFAMMSGYYASQGFYYMVAQQLLIVQIAGLVCAAYAALMDPSSEDRPIPVKRSDLL